MTLPLARILCVDDEQDSRELIDLMIYQADDFCRIVLVSSAEEALSLIKKQTFDLFIFDYNLEKMSGVELCRIIRQTDLRTPIIFFTAMAYESNRLAAMAAGATEYLVKPNDLELLTGTVKRLLNRNPQNLKGASSVKSKSRLIRDRIY